MKSWNVWWAGVWGLWVWEGIEGIWVKVRLIGLGWF